MKVSTILFITAVSCFAVWRLVEFICSRYTDNRNIVVATANFATSIVASIGIGYLHINVLPAINDIFDGLVDICQALIVVVTFFDSIRRTLGLEIDWRW